MSLNKPSYNMLGQDLHDKIGDLSQTNYTDIASGLKDHTSKLAAITSKKIYAKDHGVKLDGVTDDTAALNSFFALFGTGVELVVENGVALVTGQLNIPGQWNPPSNDGVKKLTFDNFAINYQGPAGKACVQLYNHQKSVISGLSILKSSQPTYINFVGFWYSKFENFEVPKIRFNYNTSDITATLSTNDSYTSVFEHGVTYDSSEFYGVGQTGGGNINSLTFNDVKWQGNQLTPNAQYNLKFYGTSFQNFAFNYCDLSYATNAVMYIDVAQASTMRVNFHSCYFDTNIPLIPNYDYKGAIIGLEDSQISNGEPFFFKTKNKIGMRSNGNYGSEGGNVLAPGYNLAKNGDLLSTSLSGWTFFGNNTTGGGSGNPTAAFTTNANTINGNSVQITFNQTLQYYGFDGINAPFDGYYTCSLRGRVVSGAGAVQLNFRGALTTFDLTKINVSEEFILSTHSGYALVTQGTSLYFSIQCSSLTTSPLVIEILEVSIVQGTNAAVNLPVHPKAITTSSNSTLVETGQMTRKYVGSFATTNGTANQKLDLYFTGSFIGYFDVTITGGWSSGNATGRLTKRLSLDLSTNSIIYQDTAYAELNGNTFNQLAISDVSYDSTNSRWKIQLVQLLSSVGDTYQVFVEAFSVDNASKTTMETLALSSIYTTDSTVFTIPIRTLEGGVIFKGSKATPVKIVTANVYPGVNDDTIFANATSAALTVGLPDATTMQGRIYTIKKIDSSANAVNINTTNSQMIDGATTKAITTQYTTARVQSDGSNWWVV